MEFQVGMVVKSKAGRDKDTFLVVVAVQRQTILVADGKKRLLESPKQKNAKHLSKTNLLFTIDDTTTNKQLRKFLNALYLNENKATI